jgi:hypothetical protein
VIFYEYIGLLEASSDSFLVSRRRWFFFLSLPCNEEFDYRVTPIEDVDEAKKGAVMRIIH